MKTVKISASLSTSEAFRSEASFAKAHRILKASEFAEVFKDHIKCCKGPWILRAHRRTLLRARLGLAIAKKVLARAVDRNRVKRLARESFRHHAKGLKAWDFVLSLAPRRERAPLQELDLYRKDLLKLWQRFEG